MKKIAIYVFLFTFLVLGTTATMAQNPKINAKLVTENIVSSLNYDIEGIVEATIYNTLFLTKYYPDAQIGEVLDALNDVATNSKNPVLRYKAQLAVLYITNYGKDDLNMENSKGDQSEAFRKISEKLQNSLLASSQN